MPLKRIATWKRSAQGKALLIEIDKRRFEIDHAERNTFDSVKKLESEIERQASLSSTILPSIFYHVNRDSSIAIATGQKPDVWPEDEPG